MSVVPPSRRDTFYTAALLGLHVLDSQERTPRRFGPDADARWQGFQGHLGIAERIDLLIRDAAVSWPMGFSPSRIFRLQGLASDEPFGPDWRSLPENVAQMLWSDVSATPDLDDVAAILDIPHEAIDVPQLTPATRLFVAGGAAIRAVAQVFAKSDVLSWSDQVMVVASSPSNRQLAGLVAPLIGALGTATVLTPSEDVGGSLKRAEITAGGVAIVSSDADAASANFARLAAREG